MRSLDEREPGPGLTLAEPVVPPAVAEAGDELAWGRRLAVLTVVALVSLVLASLGGAAGLALAAGAGPVPDHVRQWWLLGPGEWLGIAPAAAAGRERAHVGGGGGCSHHRPLAGGRHPAVPVLAVGNAAGICPGAHQARGTGAHVAAAGRGLAGGGGRHAPGGGGGSGGGRRGPGSVRRAGAGRWPGGGWEQRCGPVAHHRRVGAGAQGGGDGGVRRNHQRAGSAGGTGFAPGRREHAGPDHRPRIGGPERSGPHPAGHRRLRGSLCAVRDRGGAADVGGTAAVPGLDLGGRPPPFHDPVGGGQSVRPGNLDPGRLPVGHRQCRAPRRALQGWSLPRGGGAGRDRGARQDRHPHPRPAHRDGRGVGIRPVAPTSCWPWRRRWSATASISWVRQWRPRRASVAWSCRL